MISIFGCKDKQKNPNLYNFIEKYLIFNEIIANFAPENGNFYKLFS